MSYEGYEEYICPNGHYWAEDALNLVHASKNEVQKFTTCRICNQYAQYECSVDQTNGVELENPWTLSGPKSEIGFQEQECRDHRGNVFYQKIPLYKPDVESGRWREFHKVTPV